MIVVDTSVLSLAFRRRARAQAEPSAARLLRRMVLEDIHVRVPGIVLQELLSGVRREAQFARLKSLVEGFPILAAERAHHVAAARISNACRRNGVATSAVDCLIAAQAVAADAPLFTTDEDFSRMAAHCRLRLLEVKEMPGV